MLSVAVMLAILNVVMPSVVMLSVSVLSAIAAFLDSDSSN